MYGALLMFEDEFIHIVAISFSALVLTELIMVALTIRTWHRIMIIAEVLSLAFYVLSLVVLKDYFGKIRFLLTLKKLALVKILKQIISYTKVLSGDGDVVVLKGRFSSF